MKVHFLTSIYPPAVGGPATYVKNLSEKLYAMGFDPIISSLSDELKAGNYGRLLRFLIRALRKHKPEYVIFAQDTLLMPLVGLVLKYYYKSYLVIRFPGDRVWERYNSEFLLEPDPTRFQTMRDLPVSVRMGRLVQRWLLNKADLVISPSRFCQQLLTAMNVKSVVVPNFNSATISDARRTPIGKPIRRFRLLHVGRDVPWKRLNQIKRLVAADQTLELVIHTESNVGCVREAMLDADLLILNSTYEGMSHTILEALAAGLPILCTDIPANKELLTDNVTGYLFSTHATDCEILEKIELIRLNHELRDTISENGRVLVKQYTVEKTAKTLEALFNGL